MHDLYKNIEEYNLGKKLKLLIDFDDVIADTINMKKLNPIVIELFIRGRKLNISVVFITQSYFQVPKEVRRNIAHFFIMKILNEKELHQILLTNFSDINFKHFISAYHKCLAKKYYFLVNDTTLPSENLLRFRKNLLK